MSTPLVWLQDDQLSENNPALQAHPTAPCVFIFDEPLLRAAPLAFHRLQFIYECAQEVVTRRTAPGHLRRGDVVAELCALAADYGTTALVTTETPGDRFQEQVAALRAAGLRVTVLSVPSLFPYDPARAPRRFSAWWREVQG